MFVPKWCSSIFCLFSQLLKLDTYRMVRPLVSRNLAVRLAKEIFNLRVDDSLQSTVKELDSYADRNFYLRDSMDGVEREFVLKVVNSEDSEDKEMLEELHSAMILLSKNGIPCSVPQPTVSGLAFEMRLFECTPTGVTPTKRVKSDIKPVLYECAVRLFSFVPGKTMGDIPSFSLTTDLFFKVGCFAAEVDKILKDFNCPALESRYYEWDILHFNEAKKLRSAVKDPHHKQLLHNIEKSFESFVRPKLDALPKQCIHGDMNQLNLLAQNIRGSTKFEICGLIDFGDMNYTCRVFEISILAAYMMTMFLENPVQAAVHTIAGYQEMNPLPPDESDLIFYLIQARLYQSACLGTSTSLLHPENSEYLLYSVKKCWKVFDELKAISKKEFDEEWKELSNKTS